MRIAISLPLFIVAVVTVESHSQPPESPSARSLDALLQARAFEALSRHPKTGVVFDSEIPENLTGIGVSALRLRSGSLRTRGVERYREFRIPEGVTEQPYTKRIVLVYQNLGNFSSRFYPLPGFDYLAPVLGLIAYDASNLTAVGLPELDLRASGKSPITVRFDDVATTGSARCVFFDLLGSVQFDKPARGNSCEIFQQGHVSVVVESRAPSPAPDGEDYIRGQRRRGEKSKARKIVGCLVAVMVLMAGIGLFLYKFGGWRNAKRDKELENRETRGGDALEVTSFGGIKAPFARVTRTQPVLEDRYVP